MGEQAGTQHTLAGFFFGAAATLPALSPFFSSLSFPRPGATDAGGGIDPRSEVGRVEEGRTAGERNPEGEAADMRVGDV